VPSQMRYKPVLSASFLLSIPSVSYRLDRRHRLHIAFRDVGCFASDHAYQVNVVYQKVFELGWDELAMRARGVIAGGPGLRWFDEVELTSNAFPVAPSDYSYAQRIGQAGVEYRLSLHREFLKLGLFADGSVHRTDVPGSSHAGRTSGAGGAGLGLHLLVLDQFQFSVSYGFVLDQDLLFSHGALFSLRRVY